MSKIYLSGREIIFEGAEILFGSFRNFRGEKRKYNDAGKRNFNVKVEADNIAFLVEQGVNVKYFKADAEDEDQDEMDGFVKVNVNYDSYKKPEVFVRYGEKGKFVELNENSIEKLDSAVFDYVDMILNPYRRDETSNASLYLNKGYFTIHVDPLAAKYENSEDIEEEELPFS